MKLKKIKWNNHPILKNLDLDLTNQDGQLYENIILAGENGTGKSTIFIALSSFLNADVGSFANFEYIEYEIDGKTYKAVPIPNSNRNPKFNYFKIICPGKRELEVHGSKSNYNINQINSNQEDPRNYPCIFSKAHSDYKTAAIKSASTSSIDKNTGDYNIFGDNDDNFTSLKQLIVDTYYQDASDYMKKNEGTYLSLQDFEPKSKLYRFKNAFDKFFNHKLTFDEVADHGQEKIIYFKKNNQQIPIDELSTGEKQIVFRGIYLLKNSGVLESPIIMIDEPELSMHPKWQQNILDYYKGLFTTDKKQKAQLFFATHSDHVIGKALSEPSKHLVIVLTESNGEILAKPIKTPATLPKISKSEVNYLAFDLVTNDYHNELYGYLQEIRELDTVRGCDKFIVKSKNYIKKFHEKKSSHKRENDETDYESLPTYIRNAIHHPESDKDFSEEELRRSIELLIKLCDESTSKT